MAEAAYHLHWVADEALQLLAEHPGLPCHAIFVDEGGTEGLPVRMLFLRGWQIDEANHFVHLKLELGAFLHPPTNLGLKFSGWEGREQACPPRRYLAPWRATWGNPEWVGGGERMDVWRRAVDFLTGSWALPDTTFLRLEHERAYR